MILNSGEIIIHDFNYMRFTTPPTGQGMGLIPRDFKTYPVGCYASAPTATLSKKPRGDWSGLIKDMVQNKTLLSDIRMTGDNGKMIKSRDQNGRGYCWAHSPITCAVAVRARDHMPYEDLSPYAVACIIKNYRDEGGWSSQSMDFLRTKGCPTSKYWPQKSVSRTNDNAETWKNAELYKDTAWEDIPEGDFDMQMSYLLERIPHTLDLNWWSHSIGAIDPVEGTSLFGMMRNEDSGKLIDQFEFERIWRPSDFGGAFGIRIWNSWGDSWSQNGTGILTESKARNNGAVALLYMRSTP